MKTVEEHKKLWRARTPRGFRLLFGVIFTITAIGVFSSPTFAADSTISVSISGSSTIDATTLSEDGVLTTSTGPVLSVTSDNYTGYTLSISADDDKGEFIGINTDEVISSINETTSVSDFEAAGNTSYNNLWGFLPSKLNSTDNSDYLPSPTTTGTLLDKTTLANSTANTYTLAFGARTSYLTTPDTYLKTFTITVLSNSAAYQVTYDANTTATVSNLPSTTTSTLDGDNFTVTSTKPTRSDGYAFAGWCIGTATADSTTCDGTTVAAGGTYTFSEIDQTGLNSVTFYALWELEVDCPGGYICYNKNGADGTTSMANQSASASSSVMLRASNFSYTNHGFLGWSTSADPTIGTDVIYGPNETITTPSTLANEGLKLYAVWIEQDSTYTMQTFTASICSTNLTAATYDSTTGTITISADSVIALKDERDGNVYSIARLTDGNCWMLENLRLDNSATLDSTNTHNPKTSTLSATSSSWCTTSSSACIDQSMLDTTNTASAASSAASTSANTYSYGNYYNWYSATAGNGVYSTSASTVSGDICPLNWKMPIGGTSSAVGSFGYLSMSMGGLNSAMSSSTTPTAATMSARLRSFPNNLLYSGGRYSTSIDNRGSAGRYWTSTAVNDKKNAYRLSFDASSLSPGTNYGTKLAGFSVRCLAGS